MCPRRCYIRSTPDLAWITCQNQALHMFSQNSVRSPGPAAPQIRTCRARVRESRGLATPKDTRVSGSQTIAASLCNAGYMCAPCVRRCTLVFRHAHAVGAISLDSGAPRCHPVDPGRHDQMLPELSAMRRDAEPWLTPTSTLVHALRNVRTVEVNQLKNMRGTLSHHARRSRH